MTAVTLAPSHAALIMNWSNGSAPERTAAAILRQIDTGHLTRWTELPTVRETAADCGVSRATVSRARQLLARHGALVKETGRYYAA